MTDVGHAPNIALTASLAEITAGQQLPPPTRAAVLMALLGIALLGMLIVAVILLGGHWARRQGNLRRGPSVPPDRAPLVRVPPPARSKGERDEPAPPITDSNHALRETQSDLGETSAS